MRIDLHFNKLIKNYYSQNYLYDETVHQNIDQ